MGALLLGGTGMLGQAIVSEWQSVGLSIETVARAEADYCLDISDEYALKKLLLATSPEVVINAAASINVAACDANEEMAMAVNAKPSFVIAEYCENTRCRSVLVSTDHYFSGHGRRKHTEAHQVTLLNAYARSKYAAEQFALSHPAALVLRTNIVGFRGDETRPTFVEWVLNSLRDRVHMTLFDDYYTSSLDVGTFASVLRLGLEAELTGLYHLASSQVSSKMEFIKRLALVFGYEGFAHSIGSVSNLRAPRAESCGLDVSRIESALNITLPDLETVCLNLYQLSLSTPYRPVAKGLKS